MRQKQFLLMQFLASLLQSRSAFLFHCFVALIALQLNFHSGSAFAFDAPSLAKTSIQKLQADFDVLAKKNTPFVDEGSMSDPYKSDPLKNDWVALYEVCYGMFEVRDFSRIFGCADVAKKWHANTGEEPTEPPSWYPNIFHGSRLEPHYGYPTYANVMLIEAKAYLESGQYSKAIELAKHALAEDKRAYIDILKRCEADDKNPCWISNASHRQTNHQNLLKEGNLLLAAALFIEQKRDESTHFQKITEELLAQSASFFNKKVNGENQAYKVQLYLATERFDDAVRFAGNDLHLTENIFAAASAASSFLSVAGNPLGALNLLQGAGATNYLLSDLRTISGKFQLAHIRFKAKRTDEAKKQLDELLAAPLIKTFGGIYWATLYDRGQIAEGEGKLDEAVNYYTSAIDEIELQRSTINTEGARIGFFGDKQAAYQSLVRLLVQTGKAEEAFLITERSKARALVDMLANKQDFRVTSANSTKIQLALAQQQSADNLSVLKGDLPTATRSLPKSGAPTAESAKEDATAAADHIRNLKRESAQNIATLPPELASLVSVTPIKIPEILQNLPADETIVSYYYDKSNLYAFLVDRQSVKSIKLQRAGLEGEVEAFRQALQQTNGQYNGKAQALHDRLIAPLVAEIKTPKLIIAPHGALHYLPFAALFDGQSYLIDRYQLTFLPSASTIKFIGKTHTEDKTGNILVLGNPNLGDARYNLAFAEKEAKSIGAIFPKSVVLLGEKASKKNLSELGSGFRYLHFAMHGKFDSDNPLGSALMLATNSVENEKDQLTVSELYSMKLDADLVTLSACETGLGKVSNGDDVVGLVRGFLYAGANQVISTLWEIDDQATETLMVDFYRDVKAGKPKAASLRNAQIALRKAYPNPRYWAAFQMTGGAEEKLRVVANGK